MLEQVCVLYQAEMVFCIPGHSFTLGSVTLGQPVFCQRLSADCNPHTCLERMYFLEGESGWHISVFLPQQGMYVFNSSKYYCQTGFQSTCTIHCTIRDFLLFLILINSSYCQFLRILTIPVDVQRYLIRILICISWLNTLSYVYYFVMSLFSHLCLSCLPQGSLFYAGVCKQLQVHFLCVL